MENLNELLQVAIHAGIQAGEQTLKYYRQKFEVHAKQDNSPLTSADMASHHCIVDRLKNTGIPIVSEESSKDELEQRLEWDVLWLVDPLDGTKEFIKHSDEYTVNIALVKDQEPVLGVVYAPALDLLYYGNLDKGAYKLERAKQKLANVTAFDGILNVSSPLPITKVHHKPVVVASKSHLNDETIAFIENLEQSLGAIALKSIGSSLKLCMVAEGVADFYPRLGPTMEWDTAASHAIVKASGQEIVQFPETVALKYNKRDLLNPFFIVFNPKYESLIGK